MFGEFQQAYTYWTKANTKHFKRSVEAGTTGGENREATPNFDNLSNIWAKLKVFETKK